MGTIISIKGEGEEQLHFNSSHLIAVAYEGDSYQSGESKLYTIKVYLVGNMIPIYTSDPVLYETTKEKLTRALVDTTFDL